MRILFTCGGTAGHINPALAVARLAKEQDPDSEILFVGAKGGMEETLVPKGGFPIDCVTISSFWRRLDWASLSHNSKTLKNLFTARREARAILQRFQPDIVVGTGGYASYPLVREATRQHIPTAVHESNAVPGLTTTRLAKYADCVMVGLPDCEQHYPKPEKVIVTGTPVRGAFFTQTRKEAKACLGIPTDALLLLSYWGSLGARQMNRYMIDYLEREVNTPTPHVHHIHVAGGNFEGMQAVLQGKNIQLPPHIQVTDYLHNMPTVMTAADVVLCRAGASTLSELTALGRSAVLVPSPNVTNNHQEKNALILVEHGGAILQKESDCTGDMLYERTSHLLAHATERHAMETAQVRLGKPQATAEIYAILKKLCDTGR